MRRLLLGLSAAFVFSSLTLASCSDDSFTSTCENTLTCASGSGGADGSGGSAGGSSTGGSSEGGASACDPKCSGDEPVCDEEASGGPECVGCLVNDDCADNPNGTLCDADEKKCVECLELGDCTELTASACTEGQCAKCTDDDHCERFMDTPVCELDSGTCVACTKETEEERCGDYSCSSLTHTCTGKKVGLLDACDACEADSECATGRKCLKQTFSGTDVGYFCFVDQAAEACGNTDATKRPYRNPTELTSIDGATATYCMPPTTTTCQGIRDTQNVSCTTDADCGVDDLNDGYCPTIGTGANLCTYQCNGGIDCGGTLLCAGSPQHCRP